MLKHTLHPRISTMFSVINLKAEKGKPSNKYHESFSQLKSAPADFLKGKKDVQPSCSGLGLGTPQVESMKDRKGRKVEERQKWEGWGAKNSGPDRVWTWEKRKRSILMEGWKKERKKRMAIAKNIARVPAQPTADAHLTQLSSYKWCSIIPFFLHFPHVKLMLPTMRSTGKRQFSKNNAWRVWYWFLQGHSWRSLPIKIFSHFDTVFTTDHHKELFLYRGPYPTLALVTNSLKP